MITITILAICLALSLEVAFMLGGSKKDEMSKFFLSHALAEVGFITIAVALFSVFFDLVGIFSRPKGVSLENAQVASLITNIKYLVISIGTYLLFYFKYKYTLKQSDKGDD